MHWQIAVSPGLHASTGLPLSSLCSLQSNLCPLPLPVAVSSSNLGSGKSKRSNLVSRLIEKCRYEAKALWAVFSFNVVQPKHSESVKSKYSVNSVDPGTSKVAGFPRQGKGNCINWVLSDKVIPVLRVVSKQQYQATAALMVINTLQIKTKFPYHWGDASCVWITWG